ncbi:MAG: 5-formyltetrahydrofolate cyclo-ligase [Runella sp.]
MLKQELRQLFKQKRQTLTTAQVTDGSQAIARLFFSSFAVEQMKAVHCYLPLRRQNEVDTFPIILTIQEKYLQTKVIVPRSVPDTTDLEHYQWLPDMTLRLNAWGILEPDPHTAIGFRPSGIDAVIVPLLAFDRHGHRVGYGKGFYDKFLGQCRHDTLKIGVSFFEPVPQITDTDRHDVRLDYCITPTRLYKF